jgi:DNA mismatch endonuclease (patch repair protein)
MDKFSKKTRSRIMGLIKSKNTTPERKYREMLKSKGLPFVFQPKMAGHPDFLIKPNVVVFINGCFWHGCPRHFRMPKTNIGFWKSKIRNNRKRQKRVITELKKANYRVIVVWEHDLK